VTTDLDPKLVRGVEALLAEAEVLARDYDADLADALRLASEQPLGEAERRALFTKVIVRLRAGRGADAETRRRISAEVRSMVDGLVGETQIEPAERQHLDLHDRHGLKVRDVTPAPMFLGNQIPLREGFVDVLDLRFWPENHRLELHLNEFRKRFGRSPSNQDLLEILLSKVPMQGIAAKDRADFFKIEDLADSIAANGVRVPPIIDWWGTPYDGNRRLAACLFILNSAEYSDKQRDNARYVKVWQGTENTTDEQINSIVVALNFEKELKQPWPEYVRAKQVFDEFDRALELALRTDKSPDVVKIRREVGKRFGIRTNEVRRYVNMVEWASQFQAYHEDNGRDEAEVLHRTNKYFQYFYELDSGRGEDKLAVLLDGDESLKGLVFDLLYDDKFKRWAQVRDLRKVFADEEATKQLINAHATPNADIGKELVDQAIATARRRDITRKQIGAQQRVEEFTTWLEENATQVTWRSHVDVPTLQRFLGAIQAVDGTIEAVLASRGGVVIS